MTDRPDRARPYARWHQLSPDERAAVGVEARRAAVLSFLLGWRAIAQPKTGYWLMRAVKKGPEVPASIQWETTTHEPGNPDNLMERSPILTARINGDLVSWDRVWNWNKREIPKAEHDYRMALAAWASAHDPRAPAANPRKPIDLMQAPLPF